MNKKVIESNGKSIVFCIFFSMVLCICYACLNRYETQKDIAKVIENQNKIMAIQNAIIENQGQIISLQSSMTKSTLRVEQELYKVSALTFEFYGFPADKKTK